MKNNSIEKVALVSENIENKNLEKLRLIFPQFVKDRVIDFDALKAFFDKENLTTEYEKYGLRWGGKQYAFDAIRIPSVGTLIPQKDESENWNETENLMIEGDNLEVLKLLQNQYREKIKIIYIDPPYNTGKDFVYKDNFTQNKSDYYEKTGQSSDGIKLTTNMESNGRYHSDWLTMMYPRLFLAKNLLKEDGVIFVSIDDNEVANLRLIMDEIFGEENFIAQIIWEKKYAASNDNKYLSEVHEYIVLYAKSKIKWKPNLFERSLELNNKYLNPDNDKRGPWYNTNLSVKTFSEKNYYKITSPNGKTFLPPPSRCWVVSESKYQELLKDNRIYFGKDGNSRPYKKTFLSEVQQGVVPITLWFHEDAGHNIAAKSEIRDLFSDTTGLFDTPKPTKLIKRIIELSENKSDKSDIILDFFAGSGTTGHAVMDLNIKDNGKRKFILVQIPEATDEKSEAYKAGYKTISEITKERLRRAGQKISKGDIGFKVYKLSPSNYRQWTFPKSDEITAKEYIEQQKLFTESPLIDSYSEENVVYEILLKEGFNLNSKLEQKKIGELNCWTTTEEDRNLIITFKKEINLKQVELLKLTDKDLFVCFDSALDDSIKTNINRNWNVKVI